MGAPAFLANGDEMGALMRGRDWSATPLGPARTWPQPLRTVIRLLLNTRHPMFVVWGPTLACYYNDAYRAWDRTSRDREAFRRWLRTFAEDAA